MSKWEKLLQRILSLSKDLRFDELRKVLEDYGYQPITIPKHEPIKKVYVELVRNIVESEANRHENA